MAGRPSDRRPFQVLDGRRTHLLYRLRQHVSGEPPGVRLYRRRYQDGAGIDRRLLDATLGVVEPRRRVGSRREGLYLPDRAEPLARGPTVFAVLNGRFRSTCLY